MLEKKQNVFVQYRYRDWYIIKHIINICIISFTPSDTQVWYFIITVTQLYTEIYVLTGMITVTQLYINSLAPVLKCECSISLAVPGNQRVKIYI